MRCDQILRELSTPTGAVSKSELSEHIASCPECAAWAERAAQFDQIWQSTRLHEPSSLAFDRAWSHVMAQSTPLAARSAVFAMPSFARDWAVRGLAVAAALLLGWFGLKSLLVERGPRAIDPNPGAFVRISLPQVEAESGETLYIHIGGREATAQNQPLAELSENDNVAAEHDVFNHMESLSSL